MSESLFSDLLINASRQLDFTDHFPLHPYYDATNQQALSRILAEDLVYEGYGLWAQSIVELQTRPT